MSIARYMRVCRMEKAREALKKAGRTDLIGTGKNCLAAPERVQVGAKAGAVRQKKKHTIRNIPKPKKAGKK